MSASLAAFLLAPPRLTLAVAESLTCGHLQALVGRESGASRYFLGGVTAYSIPMKARLLHVDEAAAHRANAVSANIAESMAKGASRLFGSDLALATTGYAEPYPENGVTIPHAFWALAHRHRGNRFTVRSGRIEVPDADRLEVQRQVAERALAELTNFLRELRGSNQGA